MAPSIRSVLDQTYKDIEVIVVDDGSTDNTRETVKNFSDTRLRYIRHDRNRGAQAARNTGIAAAFGEYIAFQDSDDIWVKDKLEKQMRVFESSPPEVGVVYTGFLRKEGNRFKYGPPADIIEKEGDIHASLLRRNLVTTPAAVIKKECFGAAGMFDEQLPDFHDWELCIRISKYYHFRFIDEPLVIKYPRCDSITASPDAAIKAWDLLLEKHSAEFKEDKKLLSYQYTRMGTIISSRGAWFRGRKYFFHAALIDPLNVKTWLRIFFYPGMYGRIKKLLRKEQAYHIVHVDKDKANYEEGE